MTNGVTKLKTNLIHGQIMRCIDGRYSTRDGEALPLGHRLFVRGMTRALQCWVNKELLDTEIEQPGEPLSDPDELNEKIPRSDWGEDLNGNPKAPWVLTYVVYLIDPESGGSYTYLNSTTGARIAYDRLRDRVDNMRMMRGGNVIPLIELAARAMTPFGEKMRPEFTVIEWRTLGGDQPLLAAPDSSPDEAAGEPEKKETPKKKAANKLPGKPVKEPSLKEEMRDDLPDFA
jgi:hypothetical protein